MLTLGSTGVVAGAAVAGFMVYKAKMAAAVIANAQAMQVLPEVSSVVV